MKEHAINWDAVPDVITKDQLYRICHISKSTALYLLQSGKIPCEYTGRKTRCYKIKKADVIAYLENGGKALIVSDYTDQEMPNFASVLQNYGVQTVDGVVMEGDTSHYISQNPYYLLPDIKSTDITSSLSSGV